MNACQSESTTMSFDKLRQRMLSSCDKLPVMRRPDIGRTQPEPRAITCSVANGFSSAPASISLRSALQGLLRGTIGLHCREDGRVLRGTTGLLYSTAEERYERRATVQWERALAGLAAAQL